MGHKKKKKGKPPEPAGGILYIDRERVNMLAEGDNEPTGILVRAKDPISDGVFVTIDIAALTKGSLLSWLQGLGGKNQVAEDVVGILLGHGHLHEQSPPQMRGKDPKRWERN